MQSYLAWFQKDRDAHLAVLQTIGTELTASGEFAATEGLAVPFEATLVRGEKGGVPVTDGVFPESKEFLLGYWIVDVQTPRASLRNSGTNFGSTRTGRSADQYAD